MIKKAGEYLTGSPSSRNEIVKASEISFKRKNKPALER